MNGFWKINDKFETAGCLQSNFSSPTLTNPENQVGLKYKHTDSVSYAVKSDFGGNVSLGAWMNYEGKCHWFLIYIYIFFITNQPKRIKNHCFRYHFQTWTFRFSPCQISGETLDWSTTLDFQSTFERRSFKIQRRFRFFF